MFTWIKKMFTSPPKDMYVPFNGPIFPDNGDVNEWMELKLNHYKKYMPNRAWQLFSPYRGDYLPLSIYPCRKILHTR
jgi:hypothetical protein